MAGETGRWPHAMTICFLMAFFATMPLLLPNLDILHQSTIPLAGVRVPMVSPDDQSFLRSLSLSALFTALAMLFVCLLKTAYGRLRLRLVMIGAVSYLVGMAATVFLLPYLELPFLIMQLVGISLGFGLAILCMTWSLQVPIVDYRSVLRTLVLLALAVILMNALLLFLPPVIGSLIRFVMAAIATVGCVMGFRRNVRSEYGPTVPGANWWDVFGKLDVSIVEDAKDFTAPLARVLFFIVVPSVILLLLVSVMDMHHTMDFNAFPLEVIGGLLAVVCSVPLLIIKTDRRAMNFAYRLYLPIVAIVVFVVGNFASPDSHGLIIEIGVYAFCMLYGMLMSAMVLVMAGRMESLRLPVACLLLLMMGILALLSYSKIEAGSLEVFKFNALLILLALSVVLLVLMPSSRIWTYVLDGEDDRDVPQQDSSIMRLETRCDMVARAYDLTPRESEILRYLGRGHGSAYIARMLVIAESTVRSHVKSIYRKVGVASREELLACIDSVPPEETTSGKSAASMDEAKRS